MGAEVTVTDQGQYRVQLFSGALELSPELYHMACADRRLQRMLCDRVFRINRPKMIEATPPTTSGA